MKAPLKSQAQAAVLHEALDALVLWIRVFTGRTATACRCDVAVSALSSDGTHLVSSGSAAHFLNVSPKTLANWRGSGKGPEYVKVGGKIAYPIFELRVFLEQGRRGDQKRRGYGS